MNVPSVSGPDAGPAGGRARASAGGRRGVVLLGATGSIGASALRVLEERSDELAVVGLAARSSARRMAELARGLLPRAVCLTDRDASRRLGGELGDGGPVRVLAGAEGLIELATLPEADVVLCAIVGVGGLEAVLAAIRAGKDVALASKEILVMAGELVMDEARRHGVRVLPVDSEHSAVFQCLEGRLPGDLKRILLTASGGPFRGWSRAALERVTLDQALRHPSWAMGPKITVDSATLMNKGLEVIEARWLFGLPVERIDVIVHPQSIVHSMVELTDGSILAQMSVPDMRYPIQFALTFPRRMPSSMPPLDLAAIGALTFERPDAAAFPCLGLARQAGGIGGSMPAVLNAANEEAVRRFLEGKLSFVDIPRTVEHVMDRHQVVERPCLEEILAADRWARRETADYMRR